MLCTKKKLHYYIYIYTHIYAHIYIITIYLLHNFFNYIYMYKTIEYNQDQVPYKITIRKNRLWRVISQQIMKTLQKSIL